MLDHQGGRLSQVHVRLAGDVAVADAHDPPPKPGSDSAARARTARSRSVTIAQGGAGAIGDHDGPDGVVPHKLGDREDAVGRQARRHHLRGHDFPQLHGLKV